MKTEKITSYRMIKKDGSAKQEIKKSQFICHIKRIYNEEEGKEFISAIKKQHYKARHHCSAMIIGEDSQIKRSSDDGEPAGTAGVPMLKVLEQHQLTNTCAVVTRYFGGIKLGAGGLIRAYSSSVALAIREIGLVQMVELIEYKLQLSYAHYHELDRFLKKENIKKGATDFTHHVMVSIFVHKENQNEIQEKLISFFKGDIAITLGERSFVEVPLDIESLSL